MGRGQTFNVARRIHNILTTLLSFALVCAIVTTAALATARHARTGKWALPTRDDIVWLKHRFDYSSKPSRTVYLNRNTVSLRGGHDDATHNYSSLLRRGSSETVKGFTDSNYRWKKIVSCVEKRFADFNVEIVTERPNHNDYMMVHVGARPRGLKMSTKRLAGIAPFNSKPIPRAVVFAFQQSGGNRITNTCETIAHEIGHAYGLDHTYRCKDVMSYLSGCGRKTFVKAATPCGEHRKRACEDGSSTQNSYLKLMETLGPRRQLVANL
jgi:hypothetical protein